LRELPWGDLQALIAATYADEIAAIIRAGAEALGREKLASLNGDERKILSDALAGLAA
jgi:hypothetical protein